MEKSKHHNVFITKPLLICASAVTMEFIMSKLVFHEVMAVPLLMDDVIIIIYSYYTGL